MNSVFDGLYPNDVSDKEEIVIVICCGFSSLRKNVSEEHTHPLEGRLQFIGLIIGLHH